MRFLNSFLLASAGTASLAYAVPTTHAVHEERSDLVHSWVKRDRLDASSVIPVRIGLTQSNLEEGERHLLDVSDPTSDKYGKHWSSEDVVDFFRPSDETVEAVKSWLVKSGIAPERITHSDNKGWFAFDATTKEAEDLLHTEYYEFDHHDGEHTSIGCDKYHVPKDIQHHVDYVKPGISLHSHFEKRTANPAKTAPGNPSPPVDPIPSGLPSDAVGTANCDRLITPACLRALYNVPFNPNRKVAKGNTLGLYEAGTSYNQQDLNSFFAKYSKFVPSGTHPIIDSIDGAKAPTKNARRANTEAELDIELVYPLIYPQQITLYQSTQPFPKLFNTFLDAIDGSFCTGSGGKVQCGVYKPTNVISVSYGIQEVQVSEKYQKRQCAEFMKLGMQGSSIFFASGDTGVAGREENLKNPNGCLGPDDAVFNPTYPSGCPHITTVGATRVVTGQSVSQPESAAYSPSVAFYSGGGFSNLFPAPSYQKSAVANYFKTAGTQYKSYSQFGIKGVGKRNGRYNKAGRGIPDVSANGQNTAIFTVGQMAKSGGTSASSPTFASVISIINDERINSGKSPLGFLNPALYQNAGALNDVTNGTNPGCGTNGFKAAAGWDPVTGLGTPNYTKLKQVLLSL